MVHHNHCIVSCVKLWELYPFPKNFEIKIEQMLHGIQQQQKKRNTIFRAV